MVRGGAAKETELTEREREICSTIGPELRRRGLLFVGIDVIDGYLTEINVTSPTGIRAVKRLGGPDLAVAIWDAIEAKASEEITFRASAGLAGAGPRGNIPPMSLRPSSRGRTPLRAPRAARSAVQGRRAPPSFSTSSRRSHERHSGDAAAFRRAAVETAAGSACAPARGSAQSAGGRRNRPRLRRDAERRRPTISCASRSKCPPAGSPRRSPGSRCRPLSPSAAMAAACSRPSRTSISCSSCPTSAPPGVEKVVEALLYVLWDLKLKVGHATRTVDECLKQARADMTIRTTLIEARLIIGDKALFETLRSPLRQGDRRQDGARIRRRQARRARGAGQAGGRVALSRRAQRQGGQRGLARPQHAVLDLQIRLPRAQRPRAGRRWAFLAARIRAVPPLRGIPLVGALPAAFPRRPGRGAPELRRSAADRPPARLFDPCRADRRRAVHEALFPHRQRRRRSDRDRLRGARGAARQAAAGVRPLRRAPRRRSPRAIADAKDFQIDDDRVNVDARRRLRARSGQSHPPVLDRRPLEPADPSRRDAARHPVAQAHRRRACARITRRTGCSSRSLPRATRRKSRFGA